MNLTTKPLLTILSFCLPAVFLAQHHVQAQTARKKIITRVFWQDRSTQKLSYADLATTDKWHIERGWVTDFPAIDPKSQALGVMQQQGAALMVAVNGSSDSESTSGIVAIDSGVFEEPHGSHFHWKYTNVPKTIATNPSPATAINSEVVGENAYFVHSGGFVQAGFVKSNLKANSSGLKNVAAANDFRSYSTTGDKPVLAIVDNKTCFAFSRNRNEDGFGRVNVVDLSTAGQRSAHEFELPAQGVTAAIANSGKVLFAHDGGISWFASEFNGSTNGQPAKVNDVGNVDETILNATPSLFVNERNWVLFTVNSSDASALCMIDAASPQPRVTKLPIKLTNGTALSNPKTKLSLGKRLAFIFQEKTDPQTKGKEQLTIIDLDPNRDMNFADAAVKLELPIGDSQIKDGGGHHNICFDAYGRFAVFTDPADGILTIMTLNDFKVRARFKVGGVPDKIVAVGAPEHFH